LSLFIESSEGCDFFFSFFLSFFFDSSTGGNFFFSAAGGGDILLASAICVRRENLYLSLTVLWYNLFQDKNLLFHEGCVKRQRDLTIAVVYKAEIQSKVSPALLALPALPPLLLDVILLPELRCFCLE
jgi:hypothetical protein